MSRDDSEESTGSINEHTHRVTLSDALSRLPGPEGKRFAEVFQHGSLQVEIYAPRGRDPQTPHTRDEVYIVMQGSGEFVNGVHRHSFAVGDFLFVPAGIPHRFENFTDELVVWVIFYGPEGGEIPTAGEAD
ncbi:MAG TPA: cupin domain-containing protein [Pyrinomonadaceae bacterium]|jgi:mannose-6-phosphate isomerase-like protein (cupin superfamily)